MLGMVGLIPDYVLIVVGANFGLSRMTKEHLGIALALEIPFFIVLTKVDMVEKEIIKSTIKDISKLLNSNIIGKKPLIMNYDQDIEKLSKDQIIKDTDGEKHSNPNDPLSEKCSDMIDKTVELVKTGNVCPIFKLSCVTGFGIKELTHFIYKIKSRSDEANVLGKATDPVEFDIHDKFTVVGTGLVVSGLLKSGTIKTG